MTAFREAALSDPVRTPSSFSPKRHRLCSRAHAQRVAWRLCDEARTPVRDVRTSDSLQPWRVTTGAADAGETVEIEVDL